MSKPTGVCNGDLVHMKTTVTVGLPPGTSTLNAPKLRFNGSGCSGRSTMSGKAP